MLTNKQKEFLKKYSHSHEILKYNIGKGTLDENVFDMLQKAILKHEIIKISFLKSAIDAKEKQEMILDILSNLNAELVYKIGNTIIIYKENPKLPNRIIIK